MYVSGVFGCLHNLAGSNFIMSVRLHGTTQLHWMDFDEIWYLRVQKSVKKIQVSYKADKNNGYST